MAVKIKSAIILNVSLALAEITHEIYFARIFFFYESSVNIFSHGLYIQVCTTEQI